MQPITPNYGPYPKTDKNGNIRMYCRLPDGRQMHYARLIMMNYLHTNHIPKKIHIHHKDGNSLNDNIKNLSLETINNHMKIHHPLDYKYGVSKAENRSAYEKEYKKDPIRKERLLKQRREYYKRYKLDPLWVERTREQKRRSRAKYLAKNKDNLEYKERKKIRDHIYLEKYRDEINAGRRAKRQLKVLNNPEFKEKEKERQRLWRQKRRDNEVS